MLKNTENPKVQVVNNTQQVVAEVYATTMHIIGIDTLCKEQKQDETCKKLASQIHHGNKNSSMSFILSADGVLQSTKTFMVCNMT